MKVVIALFENTLADMLSLALGIRAIVGQVEQDGSDVAYLAMSRGCDAVLVDPDLPGFGGLATIRTLRGRDCAVPILVMSRVTDVSSKIAALQAGADDYLVPPYHFDEIAARIGAAVRRANGHLRSVLEFGALRIDMAQSAAFGPSGRLPLTAREYAILELLALSAGRVVSRDRVMSSLYGGADEPGQKIVDVFLCKLRKKLAQADVEDPIRCIWGRGWMLPKPDRAVPPVERAA